MKSRSKNWLISMLSWCLWLSLKSATHLNQPKQSNQVTQYFSCATKVVFEPSLKLKEYKWPLHLNWYRFVTRNPLSLPNFCLANSNFPGLATDLTKDVFLLTWITFQKPVEKKAAVSFALNCRFASVYSSELFREYRFANSRFIEFSEILWDTGLPNQDTFVSALGLLQSRNVWTN